MRQIPKIERMSSYLDDEDKKPEILDERTARIVCESCPSGYSRLRMTPPGQPTVEQLVFKGDIIETNYSTGGKVINISKWECYGLPIYTIVYVEADAKPNKDGSYRENHYRWINELVAQDGRILKLFEANDDEVTLSKDRKGQQSLFRY